MSEPALMGTWRSDTAEVRVKRGSTWITCAPLRRASITNRKPTGWHSAMSEPIIKMASLLARSHWLVVAAPLPNVAPRPGTDELCQTRAWFSIHTIPRPPPNSFLMR